MMEELDVISARERKTTRGPWETDFEGWIVSPGLGGFSVMWTGEDDSYVRWSTDADEEFVVAARQDVPKMLSALTAVLQECQWADDAGVRPHVNNIRTAIREALQ